MKGVQQQTLYVINFIIFICISSPRPPRHTVSSQTLTVMTTPAIKLATQWCVTMARVPKRNQSGMPTSNKSTIKQRRSSKISPKRRRLTTEEEDTIRGVKIQTTSRWVTPHPQVKSLTLSLFIFFITLLLLCCFCFLTARPDPTEKVHDR